MSLLAWIYGILLSLRNALYDWNWLPRSRLPGHVISIGNIAVGGTGKSPVVIALAQYLLQNGVSKPAILTRGYRGGLGRNEWLCLIDGRRVAGNAAESAKPDEALMQSRMLPGVPVVVGARRARAAMNWVTQAASQPTHWILDDGFQHRAIVRDVDVVLLDATTPFGPLLPKGRFREYTEALGRSQVIAFTRCLEGFPRKGDKAYVSLVAPGAAVFCLEAVYEKPQRVVAVKNDSQDLVAMPVLLVAGIARPEAFQAAATQKNIAVAGTYFVGDHAPIDPLVLKQRLTESAAGAVWTTAKDWARDEAAFRESGVDVYVLPMSMACDDLCRHVVGALR